MYWKNQPQSINSVLKKRFFLSGSFHEYDCLIRSSKIYPPLVKIYQLKSLNRGLCVSLSVFCILHYYCMKTFLYGSLHVHQINHVSQIEIYWCRKYWNDFHFVNCCRLSFSLCLTHVLWISIYSFNYCYFLFSFLDFLVCLHWQKIVEKWKWKATKKLFENMFLRIHIIWTLSELRICTESDEKEKKDFFFPRELITSSPLSNA